MKQLLIVIAAAFSLALNAAQCNGLTKKGERCKRVAAEGSEYCIGHADQAKTEKLKDDGTCWALTQSDTRCKHKKDGESDYCKQHAAKKVTKTPDQCRALNYSGKQCSRKPAEGYNYCKQHCGKIEASADVKGDNK